MLWNEPESVVESWSNVATNSPAVMRVLTPDDVDEDNFTDSSPDIELTDFGSVFPSPSGRYSKGPAVFPLSMGEMVEHGHHGDPAWGTKERGEDLLRVKIEALVDFLEAVKTEKYNWRGLKE